MTKTLVLRRTYEANIACGDIGEAEIRRMLAEIAAAEAEENSPFLAPPLEEHAA